MNSALKVLVADDHVLVREGLQNTLQRLSDGAQVFQAENGESVLRILADIRDLDLVLLDLFMPNTDGFELLSQVCNEYPDIPVVILSASDDPANMRKSLDRGASGFIPKSTPHNVLQGALNLVIAGGVYIPPGMLGPGFSVTGQDVIATATSAIAERLGAGLTDRQREVLGLLGQGYQNKMIASKLGLSEHTVKIHVTAIFKALGVSNRTQAVLAAQHIAVAGRE